MQILLPLTFIYKSRMENLLFTTSTFLNAADHKRLYFTSLT